MHVCAEACINIDLRGQATVQHSFFLLRDIHIIVSVPHPPFAGACVHRIRAGTQSIFSVMPPARIITQKIRWEQRGLCAKAKCAWTGWNSPNHHTRDMEHSRTAKSLLSWSPFRTYSRSTSCSRASGGRWRREKWLPLFMVLHAVTKHVYVVFTSFYLIYLFSPSFFLSFFLSLSLSIFIYLSIFLSLSLSIDLSVYMLL